MDEYYKSPEWQRRRLEAMQYADFRCQLCNANAKQLHVHPRTYDNFKNEPPTDLTVLCDGCHAKFHGKNKSVKSLELKTEWAKEVLERTSSLSRVTARVQDFAPQPPDDIEKDAYVAYVLAKQCITYLTCCDTTQKEEAFGWVLNLIRDCTSAVSEMSVCVEE
mgnify:CR=1 FL=1